MQYCDLLQLHLIIEMALFNLEGEEGEIHLPYPKHA